MDIETIRDYCLSKTGTSEGMPFDNCVLVFKVGGKIFALMNICDFSSINLKYPTELIEELRAENSAVKPGYHMSKQHWNTIELVETSWHNVTAWIDISYDLVFEKLTKKEQESLRNEL